VLNDIESSISCRDHSYIKRTATQVENQPPLVGAVWFDSVPNGSRDRFLEQRRFLKSRK